jgi:cytidine deaminase
VPEALDVPALHPRAVELHALADRARAHAYVPFSRFPVGAALLTQDGDVVVGVNVDNASYPLANCAERTAIFAAVARGITRFEALAVAGPAPTVSPCGACRQVIAEFADDDFPVIFPLDGALAQRRLGELLPVSFRLVA